MQFKVPQNVQIEDKVLPFMTMRQLIICGIGGGFAYVLYLALELQPTEVWLPPVGLITILTLAIAFVSINGVPFTTFLLLVFERFLNENKRWWIKSSGDIFLPVRIEKKTVVAATTHKKLTPEMLERLSKNLDADDPRAIRS